MACLNPPDKISGQSTIYMYDTWVFKKFIKTHNYNHAKKVYMNIEKAGHSDLFCMPEDWFDHDRVMVFPVWDMDLFDAVEDGLDAVALAKYLHDVGRCIEVLHDLNLVHGDIKPENILIKKNRATIIDMVDCYPVAHMATRAYGTMIYMPPEYQRATYHFSKPGDVWSLGMVHYACLSGRLAFAYPHHHKAVLDLDLVPHAGSHAIIRRCLNIDPRERPTIAEVCTACSAIADPDPRGETNGEGSSPGGSPGPRHDAVSACRSEGS